MSTIISGTSTRPGRGAEDLALTPLPEWQVMAEVVLRKDACGALCAHACFTNARSVPPRHHQA
ncbi:hypothetical protein [Streptomyces sp. NPDC001568]|uniref:hypothetical protein n=1 Tax=Streptomyces sp. NPDC001568 TaxID=3364588 RepID=UPI0036A5CCDD